MSLSEQAFQSVLKRLDRIADALEAGAGRDEDATDFDAAVAWRWLNTNGRGRLRPIQRRHAISLNDLHNIDRPKRLLTANTRQFLDGKPANNALLWGARGTGKSSLVKALLNEYAEQGLRLVEIEKTRLADLPEIIDLLWDRPERFILFCDDLAFQESEPGYQALKATLDGSVSATPENLLIYATSNRRHLLPEKMADNHDAEWIDGELHQSDAVEEKVSLSERFGLWLSFLPFKQDEYLKAVQHWLAVYGLSDALDEETSKEAVRWALLRGSRSGRVAHQFARDYAGRS
ncbi:MAG: ATP-binding protein [Gammaproteobacteria bacterium]